MIREEIKYYSRYFNGLKRKKYLISKKLYPSRDSIIECGFVGYYRDWERFISFQKTEIKICNKTSFYTDKEHWVFMGIGKSNIIRGHKFNKILVRKDIGSEFFEYEIMPYLTCCYKIRWY